MKATGSKLDKCQNCDHPLEDGANFCPNCGQKALPDYLSVRYFISEFLNNYFSFDSKFVNTIKPLLFKPAFLSLEFIEGRRIRYINPVQLFIFISFLYFLVDSIFLFKEDPEEISYVTLTEKGSKDPADSLAVVEDTVAIAAPDSTTASRKTILLADDAIATLPDSLEEEGGSLIGDFLERSQRFNELDKAEQNERVNKMVSYFIFLLTPVFASLLGLFFRKGKRHFLENLIFSLHIHAFYFLLAIFFMLIDRLIPGEFELFLLWVLLIAYLFVAVRKFYRYKSGATILRLLGLSILYLFIVMICFITSIIISIML